MSNSSGFEQPCIFQDLKATQATQGVVGPLVGQAPRVHRVNQGTLASPAHVVTLATPEIPSTMLRLVFFIVFWAWALPGFFKGWDRHCL